MAKGWWGVIVIITIGLSGCTGGATPIPLLPERVVATIENTPTSIVMSMIAPTTPTLLPSPSIVATETPHFPTATSAPLVTSTPPDTQPTTTPPPFTTLTPVIVDGVYIYPTMTPYLGEIDGIASAGLGLTQSQWEQLYTPSGSEGDFTTYDTREMEDGIAVRFYEERVGYIEQYFPAPYISAAEAERAGEKMMPSDALLEEVYTPEGYIGTTVRVYYSASLAETFDEALFCESEAGYFMLHYTSYDGEIDRVTLSLGTCLD